MLAEFLSKQGEWTQVMPGARACLFSLCERSFPLPLRLEPLHFEVLFCLAGMVTLTRRDGSALRLGTRQVLLLTDISDLTDTRVETGLKGVLVAVDARGARASLKAICDLLGGLTLNTDQVRRWMVSRGGCAVEGPSHWSQAAFADLDRLPQSERARWCVWKSVELLYLLSALLLFDSSWFSFTFLYAVLSFAGHGAGRWLRRMIEREQTAGKNV